MRLASESIICSAIIRAASACDRKQPGSSIGSLPMPGPYPKRPWVGHLSLITAAPAGPEILVARTEVGGLIGPSLTKAYHQIGLRPPDPASGDREMDT